MKRVFSLITASLVVADTIMSTIAFDVKEVSFLQFAVAPAARP
jgi:hypothetical protein